MYAFVAALVLGAGVPAATTAGADQKPICAKENVTGSRLGGRKICRTAEEWAETRSADRQTVERLQANRYNGNESLSAAIQRDAGRNQ